MHSCDIRIALFAGWYFPNSVGGTEAYVQALAQDLTAYGYNVCVVVPSVDEQEHHYEHNGTTVYRYPVEEKPSRRDLRNGEPPEHFDRFKHWLETWRPDVIHFHSVNTNVGMHHVRAIKALRIPLILTAHVAGLVCPRGSLMRWGKVSCDGVFSKYRCSACCLQNRGLPKPIAWPVSLLSSGSLLEGVPGRFGRMLHYTYGLQQAFDHTKEIIGLADHIVVVCKWLQDMLERNGVDRQKIVLSRHGLPVHYLTGYSEDQRSDTVIRIGYLGRFAPLKGADVLVDAFRQIPRDIPIELHLWGTVMPGDMAYLDGIRNRIAADPRIQYCGPLTDEHRHDVLSTWHAMAVPSLAWETGPLVVLEAFAAGIPVLGSRIGGIAELTEHGTSGLLVAPDDVEAWQQAMMKFYESTLSEHQWQVPPVRHSHEVASDMSRLYEAVLSPQHGRA